jgi:cold shock CspA family protein
MNRGKWVYKNTKRMRDLFNYNELVEVLEQERNMKGIVVRVVADKGYGFIRVISTGEYFFHKSDFTGFWENLVADMQEKKEIPVTFEPTESRKGLRASNVRRTDHPNEAV